MIFFCVHSFVYFLYFSSITLKRSQEKEQQSELSKDLFLLLLSNSREQGIEPTMFGLVRKHFSSGRTTHVHIDRSK